MFVAILIIMAQTWKQPRSPSVNGWINKQWCFQTILFRTEKKGAIKP